MRWRAGSRGEHPTLWRALLIAAVLVGTALPAPGALLHFVGSINNAGGPYGLGGAHGIAISPDDAHVYVASFDDNALVVLDRDAMTGGLSFVEAQIDMVNGVQGLLHPAAVAVSPDGADVYVATFFGDALAAFRRSASTGQLTFVEALFGGASGITGLTQLDAIAVSPDGAHVYAASFGDDAVAVLRRDPDSGRLTFVEAQIEGSGGVTGVFRANGVAVSPDGANVYVSSGGDNALAAFSRDPSSGSISFIAAAVDGTNGISGLNGVVAVAVSPDGANVYGLGDAALAVFQRDGHTGMLTFSGAQHDGIANAAGTSGPSAVTVSPDGNTVYVTRAGDDTLAALTRNPTDGSLMAVDEAVNGQLGVDGLAGADAVVVSSDSKFVYVAAQFSDAVAAFRAGAAPCAGDCDGDGTVTVDELVRGVNIALGTLGLDQCRSFDTTGDGMVTVDELVAAVSNALNGCPA